MKLCFRLFLMTKPLIVQAHVAPQDMDRMSPGMRAEVRFPAFKSSIMPIILGRVDSVSRDRMVDEIDAAALFLGPSRGEQNTGRGA